MTISVCIIVKDEEKVIERCINSIKGLYDELIIVDTGSTDKTVEIAEQLGARVEHFKWIDDFAAARNYAYSFATSDWIMFMDADDILQEGHVKPLREFVLSKTNSNVSAISVPYIYSHDGIGTDAMPEFKYRQNRIIKKSANPTWNGKIHEYLTFIGGVEQFDEAVFHHYRDEGKGTMNTGRNLRILKKVVDDCSEKELPRYLFYLGKECMYNGLWLEAIDAFKKYIPISTWVPEKNRAWYEIGLCYQKIDNIIEAKRSQFEAILVDENYCDPYVQLGIIAYNEKRWTDVIKWMNVSLSLKTPEVSFFDFIPNQTYVPYDYMTVAYWNIGDKRNALHCAQKCVEYKPKEVRYIKNLELLTK